MTDALFSYDDDPALPGWKRWVLRDDSRFNALLGALWVREIDARHAQVRMVPARCHSNFSDSLHGGALLGLMDVALFAGARGMGLSDAAGGVTLDLSAQFIAGSRIGTPIVAEMELLRETGRLLFMRGLVKQDDAIIASFTGTVRKPTRRP